MDGLIEINNPNRAQKVSKKVTDLDPDSKVTLSRRERFVFCARFLVKTILHDRNIEQFYIYNQYPGT